MCRHYHYNHVEINEKDYAVACKHGVKCHYVHNEFKIELDSMRISHGQPPLAVLETSFDSKKLQLSKAVFRQNLNSRQFCLAPLQLWNRRRARPGWGLCRWVCNHQRTTSLVALNCVVLFV